jgi:hypothetical protein
METVDAMVAVEEIFFVSNEADYPDTLGHLGQPAQNEQVLPERPGGCLSHVTDPTGTTEPTKNYRC